MNTLTRNGTMTTMAARIEEYGDLVVQMRRDGATVAEVLERTGMTKSVYSQFSAILRYVRDDVVDHRNARPDGYEKARYTDEQFDKFVQLWNENLLVREIRDELDVPMSCVTNMRRRASKDGLIELRSRGNAKSKVSDEEMLEHLEANDFALHSVRDIGVSAERACKYILKHLHNPDFRAKLYGKNILDDSEWAIPPLE